MTAVLERMEREAVMLDDLLDLPDPTTLHDLQELAFLEQRRWDLDAMLRNPDPQMMARNMWVAEFGDSPLGHSADGNTLASFTTSAAIFPKWTFPADYFKTGKTLNLKARGIWAATGTPTYTFRLQNITGTTVTLVTSAAIATTALTNQAWELDLDIQCRSEGTGGTLLALGDVTMGGVTGVNFLPATGTAPAAATVDTTILQEWQLEIACSASSASNTVKGIHRRLLSIN